MRHGVLCAAIVGVLVMATGVMAADAKSRGRDGQKATTRPTQREVVKSARGVILGVDIESKTIRVEVKVKQETAELLVLTDANTEFLLDSEPVTIVDLRPGMRVTVQPETGTATRVSAKSMTAKEQKEYNEKRLERSEEKGKGGQD